MTSFDRKLVAGDQFSFSNNSSTAVEYGEDYGLPFGEWNGCYCDTYGTSECRCEPEWLARDDGKSKIHHPSSFEHITPTSRVQEIAKYNQEMMELVHEVPEYAYELSLRDLVELPRIVRTARESPTRMPKSKVRTGGQEKVKKIGRRRSRSESIEGAGFLLKMFFPIPSPGKKINSISSNGSTTLTGRSSSSGSSSSSSSSSSTGNTKSRSGSTVSPKPSKNGRNASSDKNSQVKSVDMQHGALSRNLSRHQIGCYSFFHNQNKSKTRKIR